MSERSIPSSKKAAEADADVDTPLHRETSVNQPHVVSSSRRPAQSTFTKMRATFSSHPRLPLPQYTPDVPERSFFSTTPQVPSQRLSDTLAYWSKQCVLYILTVCLGLHGSSIICDVATRFKSSFPPSLPLLIDALVRFPIPYFEPPVPVGKVRARWRCVSSSYRLSYAY
jgi:hypothetical protein